MSADYENSDDILDQLGLFIIEAQEDLRDLDKNTKFEKYLK
jgi:hypothetical protein